MLRFGINVPEIWGVSAPDLHSLARQIGKRNKRLNSLAIRTARDIRRIDSKAARWIASDALRELTCDKVRARLAR